MEKEPRTLLSVIDVNYLDVRALSRCAASKVVLDSQPFSTVLRCLKGVTEVSQTFIIPPTPSWSSLRKINNLKVCAKSMTIGTRYPYPYKCYSKLPTQVSVRVKNIAK